MILYREQRWQLLSELQYLILSIGGMQFANDEIKNLYWDLIDSAASMVLSITMELKTSLQKTIDIACIQSGTMPTEVYHERTVIYKVLNSNEKFSLNPLEQVPPGQA